MKRTWYYQATAAEGPFSQTEMEHLIANGIIDGYTNVRATTVGPWMPAKDTDAFHTAFHAAFHALPRQRRRKHKFSRRAFLYAICFIVNLLVLSYY
ncbi:GYF domain-containing protein [Paenibacillus elgii]|uniref:GYF domain-containing protein n=1 Tax=Paenibacillus elgii TaxID=189691 RepID=UPI0020424426|nr:GYF domain-containing protein [Paenibacillus elgii]MCM3267748.1 GYF domain-containing protein [Paenibacillus elgii]